MNRYRGGQVGMTGFIWGFGRDGEHYKMSLPENVRLLLGLDKRRVT